MHLRDLETLRTLNLPYAKKECRDVKILSLVLLGLPSGSNSSTSRLALGRREAFADLRVRRTLLLSCTEQESNDSAWDHVNAFSYLVVSQRSFRSRTKFYKLTLAQPRNDCDGTSSQRTE